MSHPNQGGIPPTRVRLLVGILIALAASTLPAAIAGAKEGVGSFRVTCAPSHDGFFDPIVFPGQIPAGHQHEFYGSTSTGPSSGPASLLGSSTTCSDAADSSAYWHPTVFFNGVRTPATLASIYYTQRTTRKPVADIQAWPAGLRVIAGDAHAQGSQSDFIVWWDCDGAAMDLQPTAPTCPTSSRGLEVTARFPDCWDGINLDSADHKSHMSYSTSDGSGVFRCDAAHPVALPYLSMIVRWDGQYPAGESVSLSSGSTFTFHADFMNGWNQERLVALVDQCIMAQTECGRITSGTPASTVAVTSAPAPTAATVVTTTVANHNTHATTTVVTGGMTTATTAGHHSTVTSAAAPPTTEVDTRTAVTSAAATTPSLAAAPATNSHEPEAREVVGAASNGSRAGAVATVFGFVVLGAGLWALAIAGYSRLRRSLATSSD